MYKRHCIVHFTGILFAVILLGVPLSTPVEAATSIETPPHEHPLEPADTSSPRGTLFHFITYGNNIWEQYNKRGSDALKKQRQGISGYRLPRLVDLSDIPESRFTEESETRVIMLLDVLNRIQLPQPEEVPGAAEVKQENLMKWRLPHTSITLKKIDEGSRSGEWVFSRDTARNIKDYYLQTRHLPLNQGAAIEDGMAVYLSLSGWMFDWTRNLPAWSHSIYFEQTLWQWGVLVTLSLATVYFVFYSTRWALRSALLRKTSLKRKIVAPISFAMASLIFLYMMDHQIHTSGYLDAILEAFLFTLFYISLAVVIAMAGRLIANWIVSLAQLYPAAPKAQLIRMGMMILSFGIMLFLAVEWGKSLGIPVLGMVTGLGVGGIAVALAAQRTIENYIGSITLFADPPIRVGEYCVFGDKEGTVESIGWRATRIRTLDRTVVTVPNAEFSRSQIENKGVRDQILFRMGINLRLETTTDQLRRILRRIREIQLEHDLVNDEPDRTRLVNIGPHSLDLEVFAYVKTTDYVKYLAIQEELCMKILHEIEEAGTKLAPPAHINYVQQENLLGHKPESNYQETKQNG